LREVLNVGEFYAERFGVCTSKVAGRIVKGPRAKIHFGVVIGKSQGGVKDPAGYRAIAMPYSRAVCAEEGDLRVKVGCKIFD
jgi:hypothetical protein